MDNLQTKTILITGGTGFIGTPLCQKLGQLGAHVVVLTRCQKHVADTNISYISHLSELGAKAPNIVINLAGEPIAQRWTASAKERIFKSRLQITNGLVDYISHMTTPPEVLISGSAVGYYGTDEVLEFREQTPPNTKGAPFARNLCKAWEDAALRAEDYGVRTVLLRTGAVLEKNGGMLQKLLPPFQIGLGGPIGTGHQWLSWIDRDDLIGLILHAIRTDGLTGPLNATAPNPVSNLVFSKSLAKLLRRPCLLETPAIVLRLIFGEMADEIMLQGQKVWPAKAIETGYEFHHSELIPSLQKILLS